MTRRICMLGTVFALAACEAPITVAPDPGTLLLRAVRATGTSAVLPLDGGVVHIEGPTSRTVTMTPGTTKTIDGLQPGTYTVALEGMIGAELESFGETGGVTVTAGHNTPVTVTLASFVPTLSNVPSSTIIGQSLTVSFTPITKATGYRVEWDTNPDFPNPTQQETTSTSVTIPVDASGTIYIRVRARNRFGTLSRASPTASTTATFEAPDVLREKAIEAFALAFSGGDTQEGLVLLDGLFADEWVSSGTSGAHQEIDQRNVSLSNASLATVFRNLHRARLAADFAALRTALETPSDPGLPEMEDLAAFTYVLFAETFCSGVPFSEIDSEGHITPGPALTTQEMLEAARARLEEAQVTAPTGSAPYFLALLGKARAALGMGDYAAARAYAAQVPTDFNYIIPHSANPVERSNAIYVLNTVAREWSGADQEGGNGLAFRTEADPRVVWRRVPADNLGADNTTPQYDLLKYPDRATPVTLTSGMEARLIDAESLTRMGDLAGAVATLNEFRATVDLPPFAPGSPNEVLADVMHERAFWLFATGHRTGDLRRFGLEQSVPQGAYFKGGSYGSDNDLPIPTEPENNPSGLRCMSRS